MGSRVKIKESSLQQAKTIRVPINEIKEAPYNPRRDFTDAERESFYAELKEFGVLGGLVWNKRTKHLVGGHKRFRFLVAEGEKEVDVIPVDLPLKKEKLLNLALNRQGEGLWNERELEIVLSELSIEGLNLELTGFEIDPITMEPKIASAIVTPESIEKAEEDLRDVARRTRDQNRVVCPGCGMEFYIDKEDNE